MPAAETARIPEDISGRQRRVPVGHVSWRTTFRALRHRMGAVAHWLSTPIALGFGAIACAICGIVTRIVIARRERQVTN
jgi:hypothetical protein